MLKIAVATFWATFGEKSGYFYSIIWSHLSIHNETENVTAGNSNR